MGLKEILAAKKEAAAKAAALASAPAQTINVAPAPEGAMTSNNNPTNTVEQAVVTAATHPPLVVGVNSSNTNELHYTPSAPAVEEKPIYPTHDAAGKPLSGFALIQARKKVDAEWAKRQEAYTKFQTELANDLNLNESTQKEIQAPTIASPAATNLPIPQPVQNVSAIVQKEVESDAHATATPEARQAYADIKDRLDALTSMSEENLKTGMQELKRALMQNPNAVALMLSSDIGQMVIALRKMTGVEIAAQKAEKTPGAPRKKKDVLLTADELDAAFKDL